MFSANLIAVDSIPPVLCFPQILRGYLMSMKTMVILDLVASPKKWHLSKLLANCSTSWLNGKSTSQIFHWFYSTSLPYSMNFMQCYRLLGAYLASDCPEDAELIYCTVVSEAWKKSPARVIGYHYGEETLVMLLIQKSHYWVLNICCLIQSPQSCKVGICTPTFHYGK